MLHHLSSGDPEPTINPHKFTAFVYQLCPFSIRVRAVLLHHELEHDLVFVNIKDKPDWYAQHNPQKSVPFIELEKQKLGDSQMICQFLDQMKPENSLLDVSGEAGMMMAEEIWRQGFKAYHAIQFESPAITEEHRNNYFLAVKFLNDHAKLPFLTGDSVGLADYLVYPMFDAWESTLGILEDNGEHEAKFPAFSQWLKQMRGLKSIQCVSISKELYDMHSKMEKARGSS